MQKRNNYANNQRLRLIPYGTFNHHLANGQMITDDIQSDSWNDSERSDEKEPQHVAMKEKKVADCRICGQIPHIKQKIKQQPQRPSDSHATGINQIATTREYSADATLFVGIVQFHGRFLLPFLSCNRRTGLFTEGSDDVIRFHELTSAALGGFGVGKYVWTVTTDKFFAKNAFWNV